MTWLIPLQTQLGKPPFPTSHWGLLAPGSTVRFIWAEAPGSLVALNMKDPWEMLSVPAARCRTCRCYRHRLLKLQSIQGFLSELTDSDSISSEQGLGLLNGASEWQRAYPDTNSQRFITLEGKLGEGMLLDWAETATGVSAGVAFKEKREEYGLGCMGKSWLDRLGCVAK